MVKTSQETGNYSPAITNVCEILDRLRGGVPAERWLDYTLRAVFAHWAKNTAVPGEVSELLLARIQESLAQINAKSAVQAVESVLDQQPNHSAVFEALLSRGVDQLGRIRHGDLTSAVLNAFIASIARADELQPQSIIDPACGYAGTLMALGNDHAHALTGLELNETTADIAEMRLLLHGYKNFVVRQEDTLQQDLGSRWDLIVTQPPFLPRISRDEVSAQFKWIFDSRSSVDGAAIWLRLIADGLSATGRAVAVFPTSVLRRRSGEVMIDLLREDVVDALVAVPAGLLPGTNVSALVVVLNRGKESKRAGRMLICNAADLGQIGETPSVTSEQIVSSWVSNSELPDCEQWQAQIIEVETYISDFLKMPQEMLPVPPVKQQSRPEPEARGLTALHLEGFKSVDSSTTIPLRPLTLIYGKNSAGKSSLIQSLLLLGQSIRNNAFTSSGDFIDLGSFSGLQHGHVANRPMSIGVSWASAPEIDSAKMLPDPRKLRTERFTFTQATTQTTGSPSSVTVAIGTEAFALKYDEAIPSSLILTAEDAKRLVDLAYSEAATHPPGNHSKDQGNRVSRKFRQLGVDEVPFQRSALAAGELNPKFSLEFGYRAASATTHKGLEHSALRRAASYLNAISDEVGNLLDQLVYIGPLRDVPKRFSQRQLGSSNRDMPFFLLDNDAERRAVSDWLRQLGTPYELDVINPILSEYRETVGDVATMVLKDVRSGISVTPADVGFGISQVLPIVTELSARTNSVILIEQPEIHLHPALQAELGDLLIESTRASGRANQIIAETHSETLILRVQRRIREGSLASSDVIVLYVDQDNDGKCVIEELRLDADGNFMDTWPGGFFDEQFDELFGDF